MIGQVPGGSRRRIGWGAAFAAAKGANGNQETVVLDLHRLDSGSAPVPDSGHGFHGPRILRPAPPAGNEAGGQVINDFGQAAGWASGGMA
jgi:hypothetical protein